MAVILVIWLYGYLTFQDIHGLYGNGGYGGYLGYGVKIFTKVLSYMVSMQ